MLRGPYGWATSMRPYREAPKGLHASADRSRMAESILLCSLSRLDADLSFLISLQPVRTLVDFRQLPIGCAERNCDYDMARLLLNARKIRAPVHHINPNFLQETPIHGE